MGVNLPLRRLWFLGFLIVASNAFALIPIQGAALRGLSAMEARRKLLDEAESYLGTRYRYGGIDSNGMDCSGLVYASFKNSLNCSTPRTASGIYDWTEKIDRADIRPGDLVFFATVGTRISHVGIYVGRNVFIHSASEGPSKGVIYSRLEESYWNRTYKGAGRAIPWKEEGDFNCNLMPEELLY